MTRDVLVSIQERELVLLLAQGQVAKNHRSGTLVKSVGGMSHLLTVQHTLLDFKVVGHIKY